MEPNELAELYDSFRALHSELDNWVSTAKDTREEYEVIAEWIDALGDLAIGAGSNGVPSYGRQQYDRNPISIADYRDTFGNGDRVTEFQVIQTKPPTGEETRRLGVTNTIQVPVAPESEEKLPLVVEAEEELSHALRLLDEFPEYPTTVEQSEEVSNGDFVTFSDLQADGRIEEFVAKVNQVDSSPGSKQDYLLVISDTGGDSVRFPIWSKHDVSMNWDADTWYWLHDVRGKVWNSSGDKKRRLSSTMDLIVEELGEELDRARIQDLRRIHNVNIHDGSVGTRSTGNRLNTAQGASSPEINGGGTKDTGGEGEDDMVEDILDEIDFD